MPNSVNHPQKSQATTTITAFLFILTLILSACGDAPDILPEFETERAPFDLQTALANLEERRSYASEFRVTWEEFYNGERVASQLDVEQVQYKPDRQEIYATVRNEKLETRHIINFIQIEDQKWFYHQGWGDTWQEMPAGDLETLTDEVFFTPEMFLKKFSVQVDAPIQPEPAKENGVLAYHYSFDESNLTFESFKVNDANGYAYVSAEGGDLLTFYLNAEIDYTTTHVTGSGQINVMFEVTQTQPDIAIEPPQTTRTDIPLPDDVSLPDPTPIPFSRREAQTPTTNNKIRFETAADVPQIARLYQTEMPQHGWEAFSYDIPSDPTDTARLRYVKDSEGIEITVIHDEQDGTSVRIKIEPVANFQENVCGPSLCSIPARVDFPAAPDADGITFISGMGPNDRLQYQTSASMDDMVDFYTTTMPADGWTEAVLEDYTPGPNETALGYVKNNEPVVIYINNAYEVTQVLITGNPTPLTMRTDFNLEDLQLMQDFPTMPDAQFSRLLPGQLTYQTQENIETIAQFYKTELSGSGWSLQSGGVQSDETVISRYGKDATTVTVMAKSEPAESSIVWITLFREK